MIGLIYANNLNSNREYQKNEKMVGQNVDCFLKFLGTVVKRCGCCGFNLGQ